MDLNSKVYIYDKKSGVTSKELADSVKEKYNLKKICFCGRLDPMARGKMLLLGDEMCKQMDNHQQYDKTYQFDIVFGLQTDTDDFLGKLEQVKHVDNAMMLYHIIKKELEEHTKEFSQKFHKYSSIHVNGKPLWLHTKENKEIKKIPEHTVQIKSLQVFDFIESKFEPFIDNIIKTIENIDDKHDFRQDEIVCQWINFINKIDTVFSFKVEMTVTSGFYIRQFVRDISEQINFPLIVNDINRTNIDCHL